MRSLDDRLGNFAEAWKPEPGDKLIGTVIDLDERDSAFGDEPTNRHRGDRQRRRARLPRVPHRRPKRARKQRPRSVTASGSRTTARGRQELREIPRDRRADQSQPKTIDWDKHARPTRDEPPSGRRARSRRARRSRQLTTPLLGPTMHDYDRLERSNAPRKGRRPPGEVGRVEPVASVNGNTSGSASASRSGSRCQALEALGTRVARRSGRVDLAFAGDNGAAAVPRSSTGRSAAARTTPPPSSRRRGCGRSSSANATRSTGWSPKAKPTPPACTGSSATRPRSSCYPAGARTFRREWADADPPRRNRCALPRRGRARRRRRRHAARIVGGRTIRLRPPIDGGDGATGHGDRDDLLELIRAAAGDRQTRGRSGRQEFAAEHEPGAEALLGDGEDDAVLPAAATR